MGKPIGKKKLAVVLNRDGGLCVLQVSPHCDGVATVADHRANRGQGGARSLDEFSNLVAACGLCNGLKEDLEGEDRAEIVRRGLRLVPDSTHVKTALRAIVTPVEYPDGRLFYLLDDGGREEIDTQPI